MKTLKFEGLELIYSQVDAKLKVNDFDYVMSVYANAKYGIIDLNNRPSEKVLIDEFVYDLGEHLEESMQVDDETVTFCHTNKYTKEIECLEFSYDVIKENKTDIEIEVEYMGKG